MKDEGRGGRAGGEGMQLWRATVRGGFDIWGALMNHFMSRRRPLAGLFLAVALSAIGVFQCAAQEVPAVVPGAPVAAAVAAVAAAPGAPVNPPAAPAAVVPAAVSPARREETEVKPSIAERLKARLGINGPADLQAQVRVLTGERDTLRGQLQAVMAERDGFRAERDRLQADLGEVERALETQQNVVTATATQIATQVGQPLAALPAPVAGDGEPTDPVAEWRAAHKAGDRKKSAELYAKHKHAIWAAEKKGGAQD